jgi:hypothetical protein
MGTNCIGERKIDAMVNATGEVMRVPKDYLKTYQFLGKSAVASDPSQGSNELHAVAAYCKGRRFSGGAELVRAVLETEITAMTTGTVGHAKISKAWSVEAVDRRRRKACKEVDRRVVGLGEVSAYQLDRRVDVPSDESLETLAEARIPSRLPAIWHRHRRETASWPV